jgi:phage tail sheath protein FI
MPVTVSYPGIYIEELPSTSHTITPAPTSVTVFVGYTHPLKTKTFDKAVELFSFQDYEREFGGFYSSAHLDCHVAHAVNEFFLNGGSIAYVVGLKASYHDFVTTPPTPHGFEPAVLTVGNIRFTAREPTDALHQMTVTISPSPDSPNIADITIAYGQVVETYRKVAADPVDAANYIEARIGTQERPVSSLVTVAPTTTPPAGTQANYGTYVSIDREPLRYATQPADTWTTFDPADFAPVFEQDSSLDKVPIFNLMVLPGVSDSGVWSEALAFCERKRAFLILDPPPQAAADPSSAPLPLMEDLMQSARVPKSTNGAIYFPYLQSNDPVTGEPIDLPPSGLVAGVYAREDTNRGVWKAPAGLETILHGTSGVVDRGRMTDMRQGTLNPIGVNCLRDFAGIGTVVFGARTLVAQNPSFEQWRYVPVRRMALFLEQSLYDNLGWVIFEPNDEPLWAAIRTTISKFMLSLFRQGAFQGATPTEAFQVTCDSTTTTQDDINRGIVNILVAFAPLKPAEFVVIKIAQLAGQTQT